VSKAKRAFESTFRQILNYTAEIIMSIILLVIICIPLAMTIPMWFQHVLFGTPITELSINPIAWFGAQGAFWITIVLGLVSFFLGYIYLLKLKPGVISTKDEEAVVEELEISEDMDESNAAEDLEEEEEVASEDQEEDEEELLDIDEIKEDEENSEDTI
jgi:hypothetical protein